jgi:hypothetical protein
VRARPTLANREFLEKGAVCRSKPFGLRTIHLCQHGSVLLWIFFIEFGSSEVQIWPVAVNNLQNILLSNWQAWTAGGLEEAEIRAQLTQADCAQLRQDLSSRSTDPAVQQLDYKTLVDVATWICHGTHSLLWLPREIRLHRFAQAAEQFGVKQQLLIDLFQGPDLFPNPQ